jgi:hypothetical protein
MLFFYFNMFQKKINIRWLFFISHREQKLSTAQISSVWILKSYALILVCINAESNTLIFWWLAGLLSVNEEMSSCRMNAIKNKSLYLFCRVESLLLFHKHRINHNNTLNADAYIWWNVKVGKNTLGATFLYVWLVWGVVEHLRLCRKLWYFLKVWINVS